MLLVVDATVGTTDTDEAVVQGAAPRRQARRAGRQQGRRPRTEADAAALWNLGLGEPYAGLRAARPGERRPARRRPRRAARDARGPDRRRRVGGPRRVALLGKPNVGKSSLLNRLAGEDRVVVDSVAGTTVDPVDELVELGGRTWRFVDTAGIRRRAHEASGHEYYATLRTQAALEKAEVAVVLLDASEPLTEQDTRIISMVVEAGRALVIAYNKWDLVDEERRYYLEREIERELVRVPWAPRVNVSARTGRHVDRLVPALEAALAGWETRIPTGRLNAFLGDVVAATPPPGAQRQAAARSCSRPRRAPARRGSCSSRAASSRPATAGSSSAGCARSSASTGTPDRDHRAGPREARQVLSRWHDRGEVRRGLGRADAAPDEGSGL